MKTIYKVLFLLIPLFFYTSYSSANVLKNATIPLNGGDVPPTKMLNIALDKLIPGANYVVRCQITDLNNKNNQVFLSFNSYAAGVGSVYINDQLVQYYGSSAQGKLTAINNNLRVDNVTNYGATNSAISIQNLDQDDTVTVANCIASPSE